MISKVTIGKSFAGCINYNIFEKGQNNKIVRGEILYNNLCFGNSHQLIRQFNEVRKLNRNLEKPVCHISFSFAPGEKINKVLMVEIAQLCAKDIGFENRQYLVVLHKDTPTHEHFHVVINRVDYEGKTLSDSNNYKRLTEFCRKMEQAYNLVKVESPNKFQGKSMLRKDSRKDTLKELVIKSLNESNSIPEFVENLRDVGITTEIGRGIAFIDDKKVRVKGSQIGYSLDTINKKLEQNIKKVFEQKKLKSLKLGML